MRQPGSDWYDLLFEVVGDERPYLVKSKAGPMKFQEKPFIIASGGPLYPWHPRGGAYQG